LSQISIFAVLETDGTVICAHGQVAAIFATKGKLAGAC
jgi:hypothetical protein